MSLKSERLKKFENELEDLEQWLKLGLVPKKDIDKHKEEIEIVKKKINEEKERLRFLKESGEVEEYTPPKRSARPAYQEPQSMPDISVGGDEATEEGGFEGETETGTLSGETATGEETSTTTTDTSPDEEMTSTFYDEDEDPFSDKNRWKRGILEDPDADEW